MALTLNDILLLPAASGFSTVAGRSGLGRYVTSAGILDWELADLSEAGPAYNAGAPAFDGDEPSADGEVPLFESDSLIISSLLFAREDPDMLSDVIRTLNSYGVSGLAYKDVFFRDLPEDALALADALGFPVFRFGKGVWFENVIFEVMDAVRSDDAVYLGEERISAMISGKMSPSEVERTRNGVSLLLKSHIAAAYMSTAGADADRIYNSFYLNKGLRDRALLCRYDNGLFFLMTSDRNDIASYELILSNICEALAPVPAREPFFSGVHRKEEFSQVFRESYYTYLASLASGLGFSSFRDIGIFRFLIPLADTRELAEYSDHIVSSLGDMLDTALCYIKNGGDINAAAIDLRCHANTVRYRITNMKKAIGRPEATDHEFFRDVSIAAAVHRIRSRTGPAQ